MKEQSIEPQIPVFDKPARKDGAFPYTEFIYDPDTDAYQFPGGRELRPYWRDIPQGRPKFDKDRVKRYQARKQDCAACPPRPKCTPCRIVRKISLSKHKRARQKAREIAATVAYVASNRKRKHNLPGPPLMRFSARKKR
ncbi:transposase [Leisingera sp. M658]|uniref:transposase n=1 Tax=Leisingera sp. M658 TaxID=2867015 RepID=UPI0021A3BC16|nr:transposase [Leisingera sp. M658]UWQ75198.1 transposase [Leisingera sp. M658]